VVRTNSLSGSRRGHPRPLQDMFTAVPPRYDLINCLITLGQDDRWRLLAARECVAGGPARMLDLGCGTGKLAALVATLADSGTRVTGIDFSLPMLRMAVAGAGGARGRERVSFVYGDGAALPFPDEYFQCVGISFAFRNLTYKNPMALRYLAEVVRVLRPGGRFVIVESSQPESRLVRKVFHAYLRLPVRWLGSVISGNRGAYRYLAESAARFYDPGELGALLVSSGFSRICSRPLMLGTVGIHVAFKGSMTGEDPQGVNPHGRT